MPHETPAAREALNGPCAVCGLPFEARDKYAVTCPDCRPKELAMFGDDIGMVCGGCGVLTHLDELLLCEECAQVVCKTCPATCPHKER